MAKKAAAKKTREKAPTPVDKTVATLTIVDYPSLADNQKLELLDWLRKRIAELQGQEAAIAKHYTSHFHIPRPVKG